MDKYQEAFAGFNVPASDEQISREVQKIITENVDKNLTANVLKKIHGYIDLTSLTSLDTRESIWNLVERVNSYEGTRPDVPNVAAICTYPLFVDTVKQALTAQDVKIAAVSAGFPSSQTFIEVKIAETGLAVLNGADEIDVVLNLGYFMEDNYQEIAEEIAEIKEACRGAKLKVILETGALVKAELIHKTAILAIYSGADFVKTSTGKGFPGATPEAVYTLCQVIKTYSRITGRKIGIKVSGGVRTAEDAVAYYCIVQAILGEEWLTSDLFRIGASGLLNDIERRLGE